jgi:uncharacterized protein
MQLSLDNATNVYMIRAYDRGQVVVNDQTVRQSVVVSPTRLIREWLPERFEDLRIAHFENLADLEPEVVLLGTGPRLRFPDRRLLKSFADRGIGLEIMDTAAACRTYNVLMSEGRNVVAGLLMI